MDNEEALENFKAWYLDPLEVLRSSPVKVNAGWVALMITFPLYERWICSRIKLLDPAKKADPEARNKLVAADLNLTENQAGDFWVLVRNGLLHQGMPLLADKKSPGLYMSPELGLPELHDYEGKPLFYLNPWSFADHVIELLKQDTDLWWIFYTKSFPWARVQTLSEVEGDNKESDFGSSIELNITPLQPKFIYGPGTITQVSTSNMGDL